MKRTFILNLLFLIGINILIKPLYLLGVERAIQNAVSPAAYGIYFEVFNFTFLFQILSDLGIQYFNNRHVAQYPFLLRKYFPYFLSAKGLLAALYAAITIIGGFWAGYLPANWILVLILMAIQLLTTFLSYIRSNISGLGWYYTDSFLSVLDKLVVILVLGVPLLAGMFSNGFSMIWLGWAQLAGLGIAVMTGLALLVRVSGFPSLKINRPFSWLILRESLPYAVAVLLMTMYTRLDAVLIGQLYHSSREEVGYYAEAYRLLDAANMIGVLFAGLLLPMYARSVRDTPGLRLLSETGIRFLWGGVLTIVPTMMVFADEIMAELYRHTTAYSGFMLKMLMLSFIPMSGNYIFSTLLLATGFQGKVNRIYLAGGIASVLLNSWLIPTNGGIGASMVVAGTQGLVFIGMLIGCWYWIGVRIPFHLWVRFGMLACSVWVSAIISKIYLWEIWCLWVLVIPLVVGLVGIFAYKLFDSVAMWNLLRLKAQK
ncbi:MAG: oligosaccharide flippase family protein [Haliscomenobacter sp.]